MRETRLPNIVAARAARGWILAPLGIMAALLVSGSLAAQTAPTPPAFRVLPGLQPGDAVRLVFWREPDLNGDYLVDENGVVTLPLIGRRTVAGIPGQELKQTLIRELEAQLRNQSVQVSMLTRVRILGAVQKPGLYHVDATMMVGDAVALAGGATPNGRMNDIRVMRDGAVIRSKLSATDPLLSEIRSGDQIIISERTWLSRNGAIVLGAAISALGIVVAAAF
jgi:protein involved in polysaccharide export with SLBB domain